MVFFYKQYHNLADQKLDDFDAAFIDCYLFEKIYHIRESFHHILDNTDTVENAIKAINNWVEELTKKEIQIPLFDRFVKTLKSIKEYIANYVENYLSNAVTEGLKNLIKSVRRTTFGMINFENLKLRDLAISC